MTEGENFVLFIFAFFQFQPSAWYSTNVWRMNDHLASKIARGRVECHVFSHHTPSAEHKWGVAGRGSNNGGPQSHSVASVLELNSRMTEVQGIEKEQNCFNLNSAS